MCFDCVHGCACDVGWVTDWWVCGFASFYSFNGFVLFIRNHIFLLVCAHYTQHRGSFQLPEGYALLGKYSRLGSFLNFWYMFMEFSNLWQNLGCADTSFLLTYLYMISIVLVPYLIPLKYIPSLFFFFFFLKCQYI